MSEENGGAAPKMHTQARQFSQLAGRRGPVAEQMSAERELLGQLLIFCAFLGGLSLAAVIALFGVVRPVAQVGEPVVTFAQMLLALASISALCGAFFALLGFLNHNQMLDKLTKVRHLRREEVDDAAQATIRSMVNKVANTIIFRQMTRFLAVVAMAAALIGVISVAYLVAQWLALALFALAGLLLFAPIFAAQALKMRLRQVPLEHWLPNAYDADAAANGDDPPAPSQAQEETSREDPKE